MSQETIEQALQIAISHHQAGRLVEAEAIYRQILAQQPNHPNALYLLGTLAGQMGRYEEATGLLNRVITLHPHIAETQAHLGEFYRRWGKHHLAIAALRRAIALKGDYLASYDYLSTALKEQGQFEEAVAVARAALAIEPSHAEALNNLGAALAGLGRQVEAISAYEQALAIKPVYAEAFTNLGNSLQVLGRVEEAIAAHRKALAYKPDATIRFNLSIVLLLTGQLAEGWEQYEWRDRASGGPLRRHFSQPMWDGADLAGRTILLHDEQGLGDTIQFVRYIPLVARRGGRVILLCQKKLSAVLQSIAGAALVLTDTDPLPAFDVQCPLLSLPRIFGTTLDTIPADIPYVFAREDLVKRWGEELGGLRKFKVGICWAGNPRYVRDRDRSIPLASFEELARIPEVQLISLQKGPGAEQVSAVANRFEVMDLGQRLDEESGAFMDTAAIMRNIDLVITVESSLAQLAGALGVRVWTLLHFAPDWRWLLNRKDSPWYPTMRLFRQPASGDWSAVMREVAAALSGLAKR